VKEIFAHASNLPKNPSGDKIEPLSLQKMGVATLTLGLQLNVKCNLTSGQDSVFENETHSHKWGRM
jgi:hypothetical protein